MQKVVEFSKLNNILAHISPYNLKELILNEKFTTIMILVENMVQVRYRIQSMNKGEQVYEFMSHLWDTESYGNKNLNHYIDRFIKASDFLRALLETR